MLPPIEVDESLVAYGQYRQVRQGKQTGVHELWTLHVLVDGASIWRSQRLHEDVMPVSACYLLRDPVFRPVQMVFYQRWQDGREDLIEYRFAARHMTILYRDQAQDMILPADYEVYAWHTVMEHQWWGRYQRRHDLQNMTLVAPGIHTHTLWPVLLHMEADLQRTEILPGPDGPHSTRVFAVESPDFGPRTVHIDSAGVPLRWESAAELLTVELVEYVRQR